MTEEAFRMPTYDGVLRASKRIAPYGVTGTPLRESQSLSRLTRAEISVKHENHLPTGAFKVRGGINLVSQLSDTERVSGVVAASTGNHGQSVAYASKVFGVTATICVPEGANPSKVRAMKDLGAEVIFHGVDFDEAREHAAQLGDTQGLRYIHSGNEPDLIEGVGTHTLEILEADPEIEVVIVPIGGGSGGAGACIAGKGKKPGLQVIGVQAEAAPAAYRSWKERAILEDRMGTRAEGLATRVGFELPQQILWEQLDEFVLVSEAELDEAVLLMIEHTRNLVEAAGAAPLAAALKLRPELDGRRVALICSGGNITVDQLRTLLHR